MSARERTLELLMEGKQVYWWITHPANAGVARSTMDAWAHDLTERGIEFKARYAHHSIRLENGGELVFAWRNEQLRGIRPAAIANAHDPWFRAIGVELIS